MTNNNIKKILKLNVFIGILVLFSINANFAAPSNEYTIGPGIGINNTSNNNIIYSNYSKNNVDGPSDSPTSTTQNTTNQSIYTQEELIGIFYPGNTRLMKEEIEEGIYLHDGIKFKKGKSLGEFMLSGYCNCTKCSSGIGITYSGKPTRVNHTVGAKLKNIPINTYLIVENTHGKNVLSYDGVYQVEDTGSGARDNHLDIFQFTHDLAALVTYHGRTYADVYLAEPIIDNISTSSEIK